MGDYKQTKHPAFGVLSMSSTQSSGSRLFDAPGKQRSFLSFTLQTAEVVDHDGHTLISSAREPVVAQWEMTANQFFELLTRGNFNSGVPCTLRYVHGERTPEIPPMPDDLEQVATSAADRGPSETERILREIIKDLSEQKTLGVRALQELVQKLNRALGASTRDKRFWREQMREAATTLRVKVAGEVRSRLDAWLAALGAQQLRSQLEASTRSMLEDDREP